MPVSFGFSRCSGERTATLRARYSELLVSVVAFRKWAMAETRPRLGVDLTARKRRGFGEI